MIAHSLIKVLYAMRYLSTFLLIGGLITKASLLFGAEASIDADISASVSEAYSNLLVKCQGMQAELNNARRSIRRYEKERDINEDPEHKHDVYTFSYAEPGWKESKIISVTTSVEAVTRIMTEEIAAWEKAEVARINERFGLDFEMSESDNDPEHSAWAKYFATAGERNTYLRSLLGEICEAKWRISAYEVPGLERARFWLADIPSFNLMILSIDCVGEDGLERHIISTGVKCKNGYMCIIM